MSNLNNAKLVAVFTSEGGRILHIRPTKASRGMTIAYKRPSKGRMEVATALVHPNDTFTRKEGTYNAVTAFNEGRRIFIPVCPHDTDEKALKHTFANGLWQSYF